jgi:hypothetical protein
MSTCSIVTFENGKAGKEVEFRNAWGGAAFIWSALFDRYLKNPAIEYHNWLSVSARNNGKELWELADREDLSVCERIVMKSTFDYAIVRRIHFEEFCGHLREFVRMYPPVGSALCHLVAWADEIERLIVPVAEIEAVGFYGTSCSDNLWFLPAGDDEDYEGYDLNNNDKHFEVYESMESDVH